MTGRMAYRPEVMLLYEDGTGENAEVMVEDVGGNRKWRNRVGR